MFDLQLSARHERSALRFPATEANRVAGSGLYAAEQVGEDKMPVLGMHAVAEWPVDVFGWASIGTGNHQLIALLDELSRKEGGRTTDTRNGARGHGRQCA